MQVSYYLLVVFWVYLKTMSVTGSEVLNMVMATKVRAAIKMKEVLIGDLIIWPPPHQLATHAISLMAALPA